MRELCFFLFYFGKHILHTCQPSRFPQETSIFYSPSPHSLLVSQCSCIAVFLIYDKFPHRYFRLVITTCFWHCSACKSPKTLKVSTRTTTQLHRMLFAAEEESCSHLVLLSEGETERETESAKRKKYWREKFQFLIESLKGKGMYFVKSAGLIFLLSMTGTFILYSFLRINSKNKSI